jgi:cytochrome c
MKKILTTAAVMFAISGSYAFAADDVAQGEKDFKKCKVCHSIISPEGEKIVKGGKTGPNLWGVVGRAAASEADFSKYNDAILALGEEGLVWTPEMLAEYIPNAKTFLKDHYDGKVKTLMTPQKVKDVTDVIAFLAQFGAADETEGASE